MRHNNLEDHVYPGKTFGRWTVTGTYSRGDRKIECKCTCGVVKTVQISSLIHHRSQGCGYHTKKLWNRFPRVPKKDYTDVVYFRGIT